MVTVCNQPRCRLCNSDLWQTRMRSMELPEYFTSGKMNPNALYPERYSLKQLQLKGVPPVLPWLSWLRRQSVEQLIQISIQSSIGSCLPSQTAEHNTILNLKGKTSEQFFETTLRLRITVILLCPNRRGLRHMFLFVFLETGLLSIWFFRLDTCRFLFCCG